MAEVTQQVIEARKAVITAAQTLQNAGKNYPMIARFVDYVYDETSFRSMGIRTEKIYDTQSWEVHKIGLGRRVTMAAEEARDPGTRKGMSMSKISMTPAKFVVPIEISEDFFQYNLDKNAMRQRALKLFTTAMGNDLENFVYSANTLGHAVLQSEVFDDGDDTKYIKDLARSKFNGFIRQAENGNVVDAQNGQIGAPLTDLAFRALPTKFRRNRKLLSAMYSSDADQRYRLKLSGRGTAMGDAALTGANAIEIFGIKHFGAALFPDQPEMTRHVALTGTTAAALGMKNITSVVVTPSTLSGTPTAAYVESTNGTNNDYVVDAEAGTIRRTSGSSIVSTSTVKVTFKASPLMITTMPQNLVIGVGLDLRIKYDEDIYKDTWQCAIHYKGSCAVEEDSALSLVKNISSAT